MRKSKKRSASSSTSKPPDQPLVFFVDECLGTEKVPRALIAAKLRVFVITATDLTGDEAGAVLVKALPKIRRFCKKHKAPFIAGVTRMSEVTLLKIRS